LYQDNSENLSTPSVSTPSDEEQLSELISQLQGVPEEVAVAFEEQVSELISLLKDVPSEISRQVDNVDSENVPILESETQVSEVFSILESVPREDEHFGYRVDNGLTSEHDPIIALLLGQLSSVRAEEPIDDQTTSSNVLVFVSNIPDAQPRRKIRRVQREGVPISVANNEDDFQEPSQPSVQLLPSMLPVLHRETQQFLEMVGVYPNAGVVSFNPKFAFPDPISIDEPGIHPYIIITISQLYCKKIVIL
jgi:hypothetical protein